MLRKVECRSILRKVVIIYKKEGPVPFVGMNKERDKADMIDVFLPECLPIVGSSNIHSDNPLSSVQ